MLRMTRWALVALALGLGWPKLSAACSFAAEPARPIECAVSVALSVTVDGAALFPRNRTQADSLEQRLRAEAIRKLGENRIAIDPEGHDFRLEIRESPRGKILIKLSSRGPEAEDVRSDADELPSDQDVLIQIFPGESWKTPDRLERVALDLLDRAISANSSFRCDPIRTLSANGHYAFEFPPRHPEARERYLSSLSEDGILDATDLRPIGSLFALSAAGKEERVSTFRLAEEDLPEQFLVADDGLYVVGFDLRQRQSRRSGLREGNTLIYRADGSVVSRLTLDDLLTPGDIEVLLRTFTINSCRGLVGPLSAALDDERDRLLLTFRHGETEHEIAVDLETGQILTPRRDRLAQMRVTSGVSIAPGDLDPKWLETVCTEGNDPKAVFEAPDLFRESAAPFYARSIERPMPEYPTIAKRARVQWTVEVEVVVTESGRVACARTLRALMGMDKAALAAALRWRFRPFVVDGQPVRALGRFSFRFGYTDPPESQ